MTLRLVIVDDDAGVRRILKNIIAEYRLGTVLGECSDGLSAERVIADFQPDLALVDLLLPGQDGLTLIDHVSPSLPNTTFIMISQSESQQMITKAYERGVSFFIRKPINVVEVVKVIERVAESQRLRQALSLISETATRITGPVHGTHGENAENTLRSRVYRSFSDIGILGETGAKTIFQMIEHIAPLLADGTSEYQLSDMYQQISEKTSTDTKTIEQRVRRTITKALQNMANLGTEDYDNEKFQSYSTALFDFKEVRQEMNYIQGKSPYHGKISVRKFLEGLIYLAQD